MAKVAVVFNSAKPESLVSAALALAYSNGETIETINLVQMESGDISTAISGLAANQDIIYVAATTAVDVTSGNISALEAKLKAVTGVLVQWQVTNRVSGVSMAMQAWDYFNVLAAPDAINYMSNLLSKLTDAEEAQGVYIGLALVAMYNTVTDDEITFNSDFNSLKELCSILDKGILTSGVNSSRVANLPIPVVDKLKLYDVEVIGQYIANSVDINEALVPVS